jgi:hypothetical protein
MSEDASSLTLARSYTTTYLKAEFPLLEVKEMLSVAEKRKRVKN